MLDQPENFAPEKITIRASDSTWDKQGDDFGFLDSFEYMSSVDTSDPSAASPILQKPWMETKFGKNLKGAAAAPLLSPRQSCYSTASGETAVDDSRRHLLEMIQDLPDSSFELSLKYMVDSQQVNQENGDEKLVRDTRIHETIEAHFSKERTKQDDHPILHWEGFARESFLFKKFFPFFLGSKKKIAGEQNRSKVSPRPVLEASANSKSRQLKRQRSLGCCPFFVASSKGN